MTINTIPNKKIDLNDVIILVDKPADITSFDTVSVVKKILGIKKIGHSGTLDKFASGLLVLCTGRATKLTRYFLESDKRYVGTLKLGIKTDTFDSEGQVVETRPVAAVSIHQLQEAVTRFTGEILQKPPVFSALKVNGKRASDLVRRGIEVTLDSRTVSIHDIKIINIDLGSASMTIEVHCSKGTYIRSLVNDIGDYIGTGAHLSGLKRTCSGHFSVENAATIEDIRHFAESGTANKGFIVQPDTALQDFSRITVSESARTRVLNGAIFNREEVLNIIKNDKKLFTVFDETENLIAIADIDFKNWKIKYLNVFNEKCNATGE